ncbi:MAG: TonB-dependent receptor, partial [Ignavibacteriaceae bacterium]|nr:TonB-dependent receptor [Ignavibacteriaceae bacterium]
VKYRTGFGAMDANELEITGYGGIKELEKVDNEFYTLSTRYSLGALIRYANRSVIVGRQNTFTAGMDYAYQSGPVNAFENIGGNRGLSVENEFDSNVSNIGFYFLDHYNILEQKLDLFFSSRYDLSVFSNDIFIPYGSVDSSRTFNAFTPKIGLNFKITPEIALYTSYGLSYDFPALTELENNPLSSNPRYTLNPDIDPSKSDNFELGIKGNLFNSGSDFMKKVIFDITGFYYKITDEIVPFIINQKTYFRNAAKTNRKGVEIGIKTEPFEETEMVVNYTYTDFKYDEFLTTNYTPSGQVQEDYSGNYEPSVPKHIINFIFNYDFEITDDISGLLQWDCDYIAKLYVDDANSATAPDYFYGNIMLGAAYNTDLIGLVFYVGVNNIFDKRYVGFVNINDYYERYYETGEPRTFYSGLNFNLKF